MKISSVLGVAALTFTSLARAATIYGGATYDASTGTGFQFPNVYINFGQAAGNGVGLASASKYESGASKGSRGFRIDSAGNAVEMGNLGVSATGNSTVNLYAVNAAGLIVGYVEKFTAAGTTLGGRAVRFGPGSTTPIELGNIGTTAAGVTSGNATAVNAAGDTVGYMTAYNGDTALGFRAVLWNAAATTATRLGDLGTDPTGISASRAYAINTAGASIGVANKYSGATSLGQRAVRWDAGTTTATELGILGTTTTGSSSATAYVINDGGTAAGFATKYNAAGNSIGNRAVRWDAGTTAAVELDSLGAATSGSGAATASAINAGGAIVGSGTKYTTDGTASLGTRAILWNANSTAAVELGNLGLSSTGTISTASAFAINDGGLIVGSMTAYDAANTSLGTVAVLWDAANPGVAINLNTLLSAADATNWTLTSARSISNTNWVMGTGNYDPDGAAGAVAAYSRAFLIQVPEPTSLTAIACAAGFLVRRRRSN